MGVTSSKKGCEFREHLMHLQDVDDETLKSLYLGGKTRKEIAALFGASESQIKERLIAARISKRACKGLKISKEVLSRLIDQGLSMQEIAQCQGCSQSYVRKLYQIPSTQPIKNRRPEGIKLWTLTNTQREMLLGTIMGDSSIIPSSANRFRFTSGHSEKQRAYLEHKRDVLRPFSWDLRPQRKVLNGKTHLGFKLETFVHSVFNPLRELFYSTGEKRFTPELVNQLTPRSLAYWLMDDGGTSGKVLVLGYSTYREDLELVKSMMQDRFNICLRIDRHSDSFFRIVASTKVSRPGLVQLVEPFLISSMRYKIAKWSDNPEPSFVGNNIEGAETRLEPKCVNTHTAVKVTCQERSFQEAQPPASAGEDIVRPSQRCEEVSGNTSPPPVKGGVTIASHLSLSP